MNIPLTVKGIPVILTVRQTGDSFEIENVAPDFEHDSAGEVFALVGARGITRKVEECPTYRAEIMRQLSKEKT